MKQRFGVFATLVFAGTFVSPESVQVLLQETKRKSEASTMKARAKAILTNNAATRAANQTVDVRDLDHK
jgi:hypothetical protein